MDPFPPTAEADLGALSDQTPRPSPNQRPSPEADRITDSILADITAMAQIMMAGSIPPMPPIRRPGLPLDD